MEDDIKMDPEGTGW